MSAFARPSAPVFFATTIPGIDPGPYDPGMPGEEPDVSPDPAPDPEPNPDTNPLGPAPGTPGVGPGFPAPSVPGGPAPAFP